MLASFLVPLLLARTAEGAEGVLRGASITSLLGAPVHLGAFGMLVPGIAALAAAARPTRE